MLPSAANLLVLIPTTLILIPNLLIVNGQAKTGVMVYNQQTKMWEKTSELQNNETERDGIPDLHTLRLECLHYHNEYRARHGVPFLTLDFTLNAFAQQWANHLVKSDKFYHRPDNKYGENIWGKRAIGGVIKAVNLEFPGLEAIKPFYDRIDYFDFDKPEYSPVTGHFTSLVWRSTRRLGCGFGKTPTYVVIVCDYDPPGNVLDNFRQNVNPPINQQPIRKYQRLPPKTMEGGMVYNEATGMWEKTSTYKNDGNTGHYGIPDVHTLRLQCLHYQNEYRARHGVPSLILNNSLNTFAQEWAEHLVAKNKFHHRTDNIYGENMWGKRSIGGVIPSVNCLEPMKPFYDEINYYDFSNPKPSSVTGHFTALVWRSTRRMGCGFTKTPNYVVIVCNYDPPGNVNEEFRQNVNPPINDKPIRKFEDLR